MTDIFISYASEDRERARELANAFEALGWSVWWDRKIITGQTYDQAIERELTSAKSVVVLWSSHSIASEWVKNEAAVASERGVLLPALIERVPLPLEFRRKQTADLIDWDGDPSHSGFQALREGISSTIGGMTREPPTIRPQPGLRSKRRWLLPVIALAIVVLLFGAYLIGRWRMKVPEPARDEPAAEAAAEARPDRPHGRGEPAQAAPAVLNLLSAENGGRLLLAPNDAWSIAVDGKGEDYREVKVGEEAVFGFRDERAATFDSFSMLIPKSGRNPKDFELQAADESPIGPFRAIGTFHPQNMKVFTAGGWQEFKFAPVTARYLKVKLLSNYEDVVWIDLYEFRLSGQLEDAAEPRTPPERTAARGAAGELADLIVGTYSGDVISDSKGSSRTDVVLTITKLNKRRVRITSDYRRLGSVDVTLTRLGKKIVNAGGDTVFMLDTQREPFVLEYNPHGEVAYLGHKQ